MTQGLLLPLSKSPEPSHPTYSRPTWARDLLTDGSRRIIIGGGHGSGKSHTVASEIALLCSQQYERVGIVRDYKTGAQDGALQLCRARIADMEIPAATPAHSMHIDFPDTGASISAIGAIRRAENLRELETFTLIWFEESQTHSQDTLTTVAIKVRPAR